MNVESYFEEVFKIKIRYPDLPTINIGSKQRPLLIPAELVQVPGGQNRSSKVKGDMTAQMIRLAAAKPQDRVSFLTDTGEHNNDSGSVVNVLSNDATSKAFGLDSVKSELLQVRARLLPQAKLVYGDGQVHDTMLSGAWNLERKKFKEPAFDKQYQVLIVQSGGVPNNFRENVLTFINSIDKESEQTGMHLKFLGPPINCVDNIHDLQDKFEVMKGKGTEIVVVLMTDDSYANVKFAADGIGLISQCIKWKNVERSPRGLFSNILMKVNSKLGGTNHTLISRGNNLDGRTTFQEPPNSLAWVLNVPCMFVGIDVSHPDPGSDRPSIAAVTGSIDGRVSQYVAHISSQIGKTEMVACLEDSMFGIIEAFKNKNDGAYPKHIICYRDGVSDSQFDVVLDHELPAIHGALARHGIMEDACKILVLVCQKNHHTRLVYEESLGDCRYHNVSPGIVVDACGGMESITSSTQIEFYLNSHATIQGTSKPTKYTLIYDGIGMKLSEIELMTYWLCYLYVRCTRSVSIATPVYYAHWAAKRGKNIMAAGGTTDDLKKISDLYSLKDAKHMFFV
jgi:eukaryotic translation initiation factor 2C